MAYESVLICTVGLSGRAKMTEVRAAFGIRRIIGQHLALNSSSPVDQLLDISMVWGKVSLMFEFLKRI